VHRWLLRHKRFHLQLHPDLRLMDEHRRALVLSHHHCKLQRSSHDSVAELAADITAWVDEWNTNPKPFVWHKTANEILGRLASYCTKLNTK
jgi:hypothetical protein